MTNEQLDDMRIYNILNNGKETLAILEQLAKDINEIKADVDKIKRLGNFRKFEQYPISRKKYTPIQDKTDWQLGEK